MNKEGFISMSVIYTFLLLFLFLVFAIVKIYGQKTTFLDNIYKKVSHEVIIGDECIKLQNQSKFICKLLNDNETHSDESIFATGNNNGINGGLYYTSDISKADENNDGTSNKIYYFSGEVDNNYVMFANYCWKIIRTTEQGGIKLFYWGETCNTVDSNGIDLERTFNSSSDNAYIGYMYGKYGITPNEIPGCLVEYNNEAIFDREYDETNCPYKYVNNLYEATHANIIDSNIKSIVDTWYEINLKEEYGDYIINDIYCNDREAFTSLGVLGGGYGTEATYYAPYYRVKSSEGSSDESIPTFKCKQKNDQFTVGNEEDFGNGDLKYPIGLLTSDEVRYAGGTIDENITYYLYTGHSYWTMSPARFDADSNTSIVYNVSSTGRLLSVSTSETAYNTSINPVITLSEDVSISSGNGSVSNPYMVSYNE